MNILRIILVIEVMLVPISELQGQGMSFDKQCNNNTIYSAQSKIITVPEGDGRQVIIDGMFSVGEWDNALMYSMADNYNIYIKADTEALYIGLKSAKLIGELVCEIRITSDEKEVFLLHVSGGLGEGISGFPATTRFDLNNNKNWEANYVKADSLKEEVWIAAGRLLEKYDDVYNKRDGVEFKIYRKKFTGNLLKMTIGWARVEVEGDKIDKRIYNFPEDASLRNANNWMELILPTTEN